MRKFVHTVDNLNSEGTNIYDACIIAGEELSDKLGPDMAIKLYRKHRDGVYESDSFAQTTAEQNIRFMAYLDARNS